MTDKKEDAKKEKKTNNKAPAKPEVDKHAQGFKDLISALKTKSTPTDSKEITVYARETLKAVEKSQKSNSAAFKREATNTLIGLRRFVENTEKLTTKRRDELLKRIDSTKLDDKNTSYMGLTVAKDQAKSITAAARKEASLSMANTKAVIKQMESEANAKGKIIETEARVQAKSIIEAGNLKVKENKEAAKLLIKQNQEAFAEKTRLQREKLEARKAKQDEALEKRKIRQDERHEKRTQNFENLVQQHLIRHEERALKIEQDKQAFQEEVRNQKEAFASEKKQRKLEYDDMVTQQRLKNKGRIQKIRLLEKESRVRIKEIEDDAKGKAQLKHLAQRDEIEKRNSRINKGRANANQLGSSIKQGIHDANPLIHFGAQIASGLFGFFKAKTEERKLNRLDHDPNAMAKVYRSGKTVSGKPAQAAGGSQAASGRGGGSGLLGGLLGGVIGTMGGITSFFSGIVATFGKAGGFLLRGARMIPMLTGVAAIVGGIWKFFEGFNKASEFFGEKVADDDYAKRVYSGFANVVGSILGLFDTVAGWLGFDTDLQDSFKKKAVGLFDTILGLFKDVALGLGKLISYIPGLGNVSKKLEAWGSDRGNVVPSSSNVGSTLNQQTGRLNDLKEENEMKKGKAAVAANIVTDNSVRQNTTNVMSSKLDTRNDDKTHLAYGYGMA